MLIKGASIILSFYLLGSGLSLLLNNIVPGSVCGMLLLFAALRLQLIEPKSVRDVAKALTDNMAIFFVPVGVGVMSAYAVIGDNPIVFAVVPIATTALVIIVVGVLQQYLERLSNRK